MRHRIAKLEAKMQEFLDDPECKHNEQHRAHVSVGYLEDTGRFTAEVRIEFGDTQETP